MRKKKKMTPTLICGMLGCLCLGAGDWLMLFGDPTFRGNVSWLTEGAANIPQWRYNLAMFLAFPGVILYAIALFGIRGYIKRNGERKLYFYLNAFGMTPWLALHLFYIMILTLYAWMNRSGYSAISTAISEGLYGQLAWLVPVCMAVMLPVFIFWFYLQISGRTVFPRWMAFTNVIVICVILKLHTLLMPVGAVRIAFTNGLMSESMLLWFLIMLIFELGWR